MPTWVERSYIREVKPRQRYSRAYIAYMATIYDFTEYKLHQLMEAASEASNDDIADWLYYLLNEYLAGNLLISFDNGWPIVKYPEP